LENGVLSTRTLGGSAQQRPLGNRRLDLSILRGAAHQFAMSFQISFGGRTMRLVVLISIAWVAMISPSVRAGVLAGPVVNPANSHSYYLLTQNTWTASEAEALGLGGNLVTVNDASENTWVFDTFARDGGGRRALWTGLRRITDGGPFAWVSGESSGYTNWAPGEPNFGSERFVCMLPTWNAFPYAGRWNNDVDRTSTTYSTIGWDIGPFPLHGVVEVVPEPGTFSLLVVVAGLAIGSRGRAPHLTHRPNKARRRGHAGLPE
jgi:hypothetical protein